MEDEVKVEKGTPDPFPNKAKYEDGTVLNFPISHYEARTEAEIRANLINGRQEPEAVDRYVALIAEALRYHGTGFKH